MSTFEKRFSLLTRKTLPVIAGLTNYLKTSPISGSYFIFPQSGKTKQTTRNRDELRHLRISHVTQSKLKRYFYKQSAVPPGF
jgi:hypothetical protein